MHYSLFGSCPYTLGQSFLDWLDQSQAYKVCFFSDEHADCRARRAFIDDHRVDCVFSHVEPRYVDEVYGRCRHVLRIECNIPGYVTDEVRTAADRLNYEDRSRPIDIGYRGRSLPSDGRQGWEKHDIAVEFARRARGRGLVLDVDVRDERRLSSNSEVPLPGELPLHPGRRIRHLVHGPRGRGRGRVRRA